MDRRARRAPVGRKKVTAEDPFTSGDQPMQRSKSPGNNRTSIAAASPRTSVNGSSKQSVISGRGTHTPTRSSTRTIRPTAKKVAMTELDNDTSDSNRTPPASITPKSMKKRKAPGAKTPKLEIESSTTKRLIVSLGTLEISDSDDVLSESPRKRQKVDRKAIGGQNIIDLCSDDDSEAPAVTLNVEEEVIVLSGDEADSIPDRPPSVVCNTDPEMSRSAAGVDEEVGSRNITPKSDSGLGDVSLTQDVLNSLYEESLKQAPPAFLGSGHPPAFLLRSPVAVHDVPSCDVAYTKGPATPGLLTTRFFARAMSAITASRPMGTHDLVGQILPTSGVSETAGAEHALVGVSVSPGSEESPSLEDARVKDTQAPIEFEVGEVSDVSQSNDSGVSLPDPCISQPLSGISLSAAIELAGTLGEVTNTEVESTQDRKSPKVFQLEDTNHTSPPVDVEPPEFTLEETAGRASLERKADSFEQLFNESNTCGDVEMRPDEPSESFSISSDIDVPLSAPDPGEAEISSIVVEEPARKDSCDSHNSNMDCDAPSQSQKIHIQLIDPSIFENPKVHILLNCLKGVIVDQDKLTSFDLGYPDLSYTEEMTCEW